MLVLLTRPTLSLTAALAQPGPVTLVCRRDDEVYTVTKMRSGALAAEVEQYGDEPVMIDLEKLPREGWTVKG